MDSASRLQSTRTVASIPVSDLVALRANIEKAQLEGRLEVLDPGKNGVHAHNYRQAKDGEIYCTYGSCGFSARILPKQD